VPSFRASAIVDAPSRDATAEVLANLALRTEMRHRDNYFADVEAVVGSPVRMRIPLDPAIARAVDAGLLARRAPRALLRAVGDVASSP
jgi:hypothetical protein